MKKWTIEEVATGLYGKTPGPVETTLYVLADGWDGKADTGVDPVSGRLFALENIQITHEGGEAGYWYKGFSVSAHYAGMEVPVSSEEDTKIVEEVKNLHKKFRRRIEDALRKTAHVGQLDAIGRMLNVWP